MTNTENTEPEPQYDITKHIEKPTTTIHKIAIIMDWILILTIIGLFMTGWFTPVHIIHTYGGTQPINIISIEKTNQYKYNKLLEQHKTELAQGTMPPNWKENWQITLNTTKKTYEVKT